MKSLFAAALVVLVATSATFAGEDWTEGTVTEEPKPQEIEPVGTTPSGITVGRLTYGVALGTQQQAFVDVRYSSGDVQYGVTSNFDFTPLASSFRPTQLGVYYTIPNVAFHVALDSYAVAVTRRITTDVALRFVVGSGGQAVEVVAQSEGWTLAGAVQWQNGLPTTGIVLQHSSAFVVGN